MGGSQVEKVRWDEGRIKTRREGGICVCMVGGFVAAGYGSLGMHGQVQLGQFATAYMGYEGVHLWARGIWRCLNGWNWEC